MPPSTLRSMPAQKLLSSAARKRAAAPTSSGRSIRPRGMTDAKDAKSLAHQLVILYDGAGVSAWLDRDPSAETAARTVAAALVDAAVPD